MPGFHSTVSRMLWCPATFNKIKESKGSWSAVGKGQSRKCTFCTRAGSLGCDTQPRSPEWGLCWDLPSPGWRPHSQAAPAWAGSRLQPPSAAEPAARSPGVLAPLLSSSRVNMQLPLLRHPCTATMRSCTTDPRLSWRKQSSLRAQGRALSQKWDSSGPGWCWSPHATAAAVQQRAEELRTTAPQAPLYIRLHCRAFAFFLS